MKYDMVEEMKKSIAEGEIGKSKSLLVNGLLWNESEGIVKELEALAEENSIFEEDNEVSLEKKEDETQGEYIDRINTEIKLNFSREKYIVLKEEFNKYHFMEPDMNDDSKKATFITSDDKNLDKEMHKNGKVVNQNETKKLLIGTAIVVGAVGLISLIRKDKSKNK